MDPTKATKDTTVVITGNSIFKIMGYTEVSGEVLTTREGGFSFSCNETGAIETYDYGDGEVTVTN